MLNLKVNYQVNYQQLISHESNCIFDFFFPIKMKSLNIVFWADENLRLEKYYLARNIWEVLNRKVSLLSI